jgi:hypothetical protein
MSATTRAVAAAALALLGFAAGADDAPALSVGLKAEVDGEDGYAFSGDLTWFAGERTQLFVAGNYADTTADFSGLSTRGFDVGASHDFGRVAVDAWYNQWQDSDVLTARSLNAALHVEAGAFTVSLLAQARESDFDPFPASATVTLRTGEEITIDAVADCSLDNTGLGLRLAWRGERLDAYASGMSYDYDDVACGFDSPLLDRLRRNRPAVFRQFAPRIIGPLSVNATSRIGAENSLLDSSLGAGLGWDTGPRRYALDVVRQQDYFTALEADTASVSVTFRVDLTLDLMLEGGVTDSDYLGSTWFAGVGLRKLF